MTTQTKQEQALEFWDDGWSVFPLKKDKTPLVSTTEFLKRRPTEDEVKEMWTRFPDANVGLACGKVSGRTVIDIDDGEDIFPDDTLIVKTPRGKGKHKIFQYAPGISSAPGAYYDGIDVRNDGYYIVAAGSYCEYEKAGEHISGEYKIINSFPAASFPKEFFKRVTNEGGSGKGRVSLSELLNIKEGGRHGGLGEVLKYLAARVNREDEETLRLLMQAWNKQCCNPPLPEEEVDKYVLWKAEKVYADLQGIKMIDNLKTTKEGLDFFAEVPLSFGMVRVKFSEIDRTRNTFEAILSIQVIHNTEGTFPAYEQKVNLLSASAVTNLRRDLDSAIGNKKDGYNWTMILNTAGRVIKKRIEDEEKQEWLTDLSSYEESTYLVEHLVQEGVATVVHGDGSTGKSYFCLYMAVCAALGKDFLGKKTEFFKTLYIDYESTLTSLNNRVHNIANQLGVDHADIAEHIQYYKPQASLADERAIIARMVNEEDYKVIIIDAGAAASGGSPIDEQAVLKLFNALDRIPCAKLIVHHEPKDATGAHDKAYYGTTFWRNAPRLVWRLKREAKEGTRSIIKALHHKANDDGESTPFTYAMEFFNEERKVSFSITDDLEVSDSDRILQYLSGGIASEKEITEELDLTRTTARRCLIDLLSSEKIVKEKEGRIYVYSLKPSDPLL